MGAWTERHPERAGAFTIDVEALDAERTERDEMAAFKRALTAPQNDPNAFTDSYGRKHSTLEVTRVFYGVASAVILMFGCGTLLFTSTPLVVLALGFVVGMTLPQLWLSYEFGKSRARAQKTRAKFTLTLDAAGLVVEREGKGLAATIELDAIERFEGQRRIVLVDRSGQRTLLPLSLATAVENEALADRLNAATMEARASRGGYRGVGPRGATPELEPQSEAPLDEGRARERR